MFRLEGCWLTPGEQEEAIAMAVKGGSLTWDNTHKLPLKMGGTTDIYENLRLTRSKPEMMRYFAALLANPLRRLRIDRFVEIPEAVSPLAGHITAITDIPMVTIREEEKAGRVVKGKVIGDLKPGERVAIIDNVITDGASKIMPLSMLRERGVEVAAIVVLMDRQQGWKKKLVQAGYGSTAVWGGFTLHDARKYLIGNGLMQRCSPDAESKNPFIIALDGKGWEEILPLADQLRTSGSILKVNDLLLRKGVEWLLPNLSVYGRVMADFKGHDITNTLENYAKVFAECPPWAITVHASGGPAMVKATRAKLDEIGAKSTKLLAVTVLTSIDPKTCREVYCRLPARQVKALAKSVAGSVDGFVCAPKVEEVGVLSKLYPGKIFVTPSVRSPGADVGDQKRVDTPANAMKNGATNLVMGRQILGAEDPVFEINRVMKDELNIQ